MDLFHNGVLVPAMVVRVMSEFSFIHISSNLRFKIFCVYGGGFDSVCWRNNVFL